LYIKIRKRQILKERAYVSHVPNVYFSLALKKYGTY